MGIPANLLILLIAHYMKNNNSFYSWFMYNITVCDLVILIYTTVKLLYIRNGEDFTGWLPNDWFGSIICKGMISMTSFYILKLGRRLFEILLAYLGANQVCMIGSFIIIATMSCERYFNIMAYTGTMCRCNFFTKKIANIFTWTAVWIIAICLSMPILINSRIIQVREQIQCKVTWEYVPKDICEDQVYSRLISMDESMKSNITSCPQSGISKCSLGLDSRYSMTTVERPVHAVNFTVN